MRVLFVTDLHGSKWKYERLFKAAKDFRANIVINGGDLLPGNNEPFSQGEFITNYLDNHFARFNSAGIYYLCYLGNDDLRIFDELFEETCNKYYPFRLKDRCRMDTDDYIFQEQFGTGLLSTPDGWQEIDDWFTHVKKLPTIEVELSRLVRPKDMANSVYVIESLRLLHPRLREERILDTARNILLIGVEGNTTQFRLNKQVAFAGKVNF
ncbi:MAG: metallophosphoesterase, partial [Candidatus Methanoperedenaceae archaeon]|nr:metallophosphoesterase [Candidatus Methanoperedenaceae archaeon]